MYKGLSFCLAGWHMSKVFISYRRDDAAGYAHAIQSQLLQHLSRDQVFMDVDTVEPGLDFVHAIEHAVSECDVFVAVIGKRWLGAESSGIPRLNNAKDYVRLEVSTALSRDIRVIPVLVDGMAMPEEESLPSVMQPITRRNALEISNTRFRYDVDQLITAVRRILDASETKRKADQEQERTRAHQEAEQRRLEVEAPQTAEQERLGEEDRRREEKSRRKAAENDGKRIEEEERNRAEQEVERRRSELEGQRQAELERLHAHEKRRSEEEEAKHKAEEQDRRRIEAEAQRRLEEERLTELELQRSSKEARENAERNERLHEQEQQRTTEQENRRRMEEAVSRAQLREELAQEKGSYGPKYNRRLLYVGGGVISIILIAVIASLVMPKKELPAPRPLPPPTVEEQKSTAPAAGDYHSPSHPSPLLTSKPIATDDPTTALVAMVSSNYKCEYNENYLENVSDSYGPNPGIGPKALSAVVCDPETGVNDGVIIQLFASAQDANKALHVGGVFNPGVRFSTTTPGDCLVKVGHHGTYQDSNGSGEVACFRYPAKINPYEFNWTDNGRRVRVSYLPSGSKPPTYAEAVQRWLATRSALWKSK